MFTYMDVEIKLTLFLAMLFIGILGPITKVYHFFVITLVIPKSKFLHDQANSNTTDYGSGNFHSKKNMPNFFNRKIFRDIGEHFIDDTVENKFYSFNEILILYSLPLSVLPFIIGYLCDKFGRKPMLLLGHVINMINYSFVGLNFYVNHRIIFKIHFVIAGIVFSIYRVVIPVYLAEISPQRIRGFVLSTHVYGNSLGLLCGLFLNDINVEEKYYNYFITIILMAPIILTLISTIVIHCKIPESPRYLYLQTTRFQEAFSSYVCFNSAEMSPSFFHELNNENTLEPVNDHSCLNMFCHKYYKTLMLLMFLLNTIKPFSGYVFCMYFVVKLLNDKTLEWKQKILIKFILVIATTSSFICSLLIDRCGRKQILVISSILVAFFLLVISFTISSTYFETLLATSLFILLFVFYAACCLGTSYLPDIIFVELFVQASRATGYGLGFSIQSVSVSMIWSILNVYTNIPFMYIILAHFMFLMGDITLIVLYLPETSDRTFYHIFTKLANLR